MVDKLQARRASNGFGDDVSPSVAAEYILVLSRELAGLARSTRLPELAQALDWVTSLAGEAQSREKAAPDDAA